MLKDLLEEARLHSLSEHLYSGGVVPGAQFAAVDALDFGLPEKPRAKGRLHEGAGVDFVIGLWDDGEAAVCAIHDGEGKAVIGTRTLRDGLFSAIDSAGDEQFRRSLFISSRRDSPLTILETFDLPTMTPNCAQRTTTTGASQALWFLNDESINSLSAFMAEQLMDSEAEANQRVSRVFERFFATAPTDAELIECAEFLTQQTELARRDPDADWQKQLSDRPRVAESRALAILCQSLMASNRFLYVD